MGLSPQQLTSDIELSESGAYAIDPTGVNLRAYPFPYVAALAVSNDCDSMSRAAFEDWHAFVNGEGVTRYGDGLRLEVGDSFWIWSGPRQDVFALHHQFPDQLPRIDSSYVRRIVELGRLGWLDTLHSLGNWQQDYKAFRHDLGDRSEAQYALERLDSLGLKPTVYVNHSFSPSNVAGPWGHYQKADDPTHKMYCLDLLKAFGFRFFWIDYCFELNKFGDHLRYQSTEELRQAAKSFGWRQWMVRRHADGVISDVPQQDNSAELRRELIGFFNRTYNVVSARDGSPIMVFKRHRGSDAPTSNTFPLQASASNLDNLEASGGAVIIYQHFGVRSEPSGPHSGDLPRRRPNTPPVFDEDTVAAWYDIGTRAHAGRLFVATTSRLLQYLWMRETLQIRVAKSDNHWHVTLEGFNCPVKGFGELSDADINGLSFVVPETAPEVTVEIGGRMQQLEMRRKADPANPGHHSIFRPWIALQWLQPEIS